MIRPFLNEDINAVMGLWLASNTQAHGFIPESYWKNNYEEVKRMIPEAEVYVYEKNGRIWGFIGLSGDYIAGIFVDSAVRSQGIGKQLLDHAKTEKSRLTLQVYEKNRRAADFYLRAGFCVQGRQTDEQTGEEEWLMNWDRIPVKREG